jgi:hypothetical protein
MLNLKELKPHIHFKQTSPFEGIVYTDCCYSPYIELKMTKEKEADIKEAFLLMRKKYEKRITKLQKQIRISSVKVAAFYIGKINAWEEMLTEINTILK